ncbi:MAG: hypothetical protein HGB26_04055 [Desulfobulbaceae bacterium]|nr:hypothetical protein [Desulfobulbaceae bacterium]
MTAHLRPETQSELLAAILNDLRLDEAASTIKRPLGDDPRPSTLNYLLNDHFIDEEHFRQETHKKLIEIGTAEYNFLRTRGIYVDDGDALFALGYALKHTDLDSTLLQFEVGDAAGRYLSFAEGLLDSVMTQLRTPHIRIEKEPFHDPCCCPGC